MDRFDIAVIGTGPAGLEAAITGKVRNKKILLLGTTPDSDKVSKAHTIWNYLGIPNVSGGELAKAYRDHLAQLDIVVTADRVNAVYAMGEYFAIQGHKGDYEAEAVVLATGMSADKPLQGETENLGRGVSYCATCDAALYKGKTAVVIAYDRPDEAEAEFLAERAEKVYYLPQYEMKEPMLRDNIQVIPEILPLGFRKSDKGMILDLKERGGSFGSLSADGIFILRQQVIPAQLVPGLRMEGVHVAVDRQMRTNIPGLFACGDITGTPYQYIKAAGEGNVAALSAVRYLSEKFRKSKGEAGRYGKED